MTLASKLWITWFAVWFVISVGLLVASIVAQPSNVTFAAIVVALNAAFFGNTTRAELSRSRSTRR